MRNVNISIELESEFDETVLLVSQIKKQFKTLTEFEALQIAVKISQNTKIGKIDESILKAFGCTSDSSPAFLKAIAMALGYGQSFMTSIPEAIGELSRSLDNISEKYLSNTSLTVVSFSFK